MPSTFTPNKNIELPANGADVNTWDVPANSDFTIIDTALGGVTALNVTGASGTITLTATQYTPPNIIITGTLTANVIYRLPSGVGGLWTISNGTTGAFTVTFASAAGGPTLVLAQGFRTQVVADGTSNGIAPTSTVPGAAAGSTGQIQVNSGGVFAAYAGLTYDGTSSFTVSSTTGGVNVGVFISGVAGQDRKLVLQTGGVDRWWIDNNGDAEGGSNAGSNLNINAFSDAGAVLFNVFSANRATGFVTIPRGLSTPGTTAVAALTTPNIVEAANITGAGIGAGVVNIYPSTASIVYFQGNTTSSWTSNITWSAGTTLNSVMATGQAITVVLLATQGSTAYYSPFVEVDGVLQTVFWQGGSAPTAGHPNGIDVYTYTIIKGGNNNFAVLASLTQF